MKTDNKDPILVFKSSKDWSSWLVDNHSKSSGVLLRIYKKGREAKSVTYDEALDEALCFGWIDGQKKSFDEESWLQRFTPRKAKSIWSKRNREHVDRLTAEKRMRPAGLREVEAAKMDGRFEAAYSSQKNMEVPEDFLKRLKVDRKAYEFFLTLNRANMYAIAWRLETAKKPETREKRMGALLQMMHDGEKIH